MSMNANVIVERLYFPGNESGATSEAGINSAHDYANWGGEFVDDAVRFSEQAFQATDIVVATGIRIIGPASEVGTADLL